MGLFKTPKAPAIPKQAPAASTSVKQSEAQNVARIKRRRLTDNSSYRNTILAGQSDGYASGTKTLMGQ